ncbi:MAG: uroporphyrinogen decarboxylase family protein, partial [Chloroflexota bacterium]
IGFSGAPFTLASYAIEGGSSRNYAQTKTLMYTFPDLWHKLMDTLAQAVGHYLKAQVDAGVQVLQIFDSWAGALSPADYEAYVLPYSQKAVALARVDNDVPIIHFSTSTTGLLPSIRSIGADVIGLDWRVDLADTWASLGNDVAVQGNLDPLVLFAPIPEIKKQVARILDSVNNQPGYIFNLGHGILPQTPVDHVKALVDFVHEYSESKQVDNE